MGCQDPATPVIVARAVGVRERIRYFFSPSPRRPDQRLHV
jgi:hypothetical protein